ncbi:E3 ubiquitin-protein ligase HRD1 KNAG_0E02740 [Huiozyma naganishii CBS 8797]|uniref:RING-type domain-containing protein n=1 Tax=Huiozyma naganishii (strain ATCC MYA-139 / BCRC 22969 / CBS 8797 / KCTC 17520 / NBRC 10181 / NCYC 3082 / Yp74L-3) TaxID=1071383 RepID=J7RLW7_HUIN7|nr:hypothetical protein KNAG_0E02740 [Kazachstania naganishii CBS 8797]CCK70533.1 hypothetical protein KNAG_0E02740 [Kazachstania naganishii CBS 8797]
MLVLNLRSRKQQFALLVVVIYLLTAFTVINAFGNSHTFLEWTTGLTQGVNYVIIAAFSLLNIVLLWKGFTYMVFGDLRLIEEEHIFERIPLTVINLIMISSLLSDKYMFDIVLLGGLLLVLKVSHWILRDRLEGFLQRINDTTTLTSLLFSKFSRNLLIFGILDYFVTKICFFNHFGNFYHHGDFSNITQIMFGLEYAVVFIDLINILCHTVLNFYAFHRTQLQSARFNLEMMNDDFSEDENDSGVNADGGLEGKFIYEKLIDFVAGVLRTGLHFTMLIPLRFQSMLVKDFVWDLFNLVNNGNSLWKIYKNNRQLNKKLPNIAIEDLLDHDNMCIVCMDDLVLVHHPTKRRQSVQEECDDEKNTEKDKPSTTEEDLSEVEPTQGDIDRMADSKKPKKLPCGHMLHFSCLKNWMERSQTCPICRVPVFDKDGNVRPSIAKTRRSPPMSSSRSANRSRASPAPIPTPTLTPTPTQTQAQTQPQTTPTSTAPTLPVQVSLMDIPNRTKSRFAIEKDTADDQERNITIRFRDLNDPSKSFKATVNVQRNPYLHEAAFTSS